MARLPPEFNRPVYTPRPRYPDPERVVRPTTMPPGFPAQMTSSEAGRMYPIHDHCAFVNVHGEGTTGTDASHFHRVQGFQVLPDASDGHTHRLTGLPCGAGVGTVPSPFRRY